MTTITVEKVFPMTADAKSGGLKATDGNIYKFLAWQAKFIRQGETIEVPISESEFNGKIYKWFAKTWPSKDQQQAARQATSPPQQPAPQQPGPPNIPPTGYVPQTRPATPPPSNGNGQTKDAAMFVMGVVGRAMGSGKFDTQDIPLLARAAAQAWNEVKGQL